MSLRGLLPGTRSATLAECVPLLAIALEYVSRGPASLTVDAVENYRLGAVKILEHLRPVIEREADHGSRGEGDGEADQQRAPFSVAADQTGAELNDPPPIQQHDGEDRWTVTVGVPRYGTDRAFVGYVGTALDVTDRKLVEAALLESHAALGERTVELERRTTQLSQMASDLTLAEQRAREELAQTLHDGLQQLLTVATMKVETHIMREAQRGTPADELLQAKYHLQEAIADFRAAAQRLPERVDVFYHLALAVDADIKRTDALRAAEQPVRLPPADASVRDLSERLRR